MRRPRLSLRLAMLLVAIAALECTAWRLQERSKGLGLIAMRHEVLSELLSRGHADTGPDEELSTYHAALAVKYQRAARHPWLPVGPDPPEPGASQ